MENENNNTTKDEELIVVEDDASYPSSTALTFEEIEQEAKKMRLEQDIAAEVVSTEPPQETIAEPSVFVRTYDDDVARAMNVSDAKVVQELMYNARERETIEELERSNKKAKGWYIFGSILLILVALGAFGYGIYYYRGLTVPVIESVSVGVFPGTDPINTSNTTIELVLEQVPNLLLSKDKPYLLSLVDDNTQTLLNTTALFSFLGVYPSEPFVAALANIRIGTMDTDSGTTSFVIMSVPDMNIALKEFLISEPSLLSLFAKVLQIDVGTIAPETTATFTGEYRYNLPVRSLYTADETGTRNLTLLYASITDNIIVVTTDPFVLKTIYDTILRQ